MIYCQTLFVPLSGVFESRFAEGFVRLAISDFEMLLVVKGRVFCVPVEPLTLLVVTLWIVEG